MYYIYGEEKTDWLVYLICDKESKYKVKINNKIYYTNFISSIICMNEKLDIIRSSSEDEMKYIRELRKKNKLSIRNLNNICGGYSVNNLFNLKTLKLFKLNLITCDII